MQNLQTPQPNGFWLVTSAAILWGTIGVATQGIYNIDDTSSLFINLTRMLIATPILLAACWSRVEQPFFNIPRRDWFIMLLSGTLLAISQAAYFAAIRASGVTIPTLLTLCIAPLMVTFSSVMLKLEKITSRLLIALVCALTGSVLLVGFSPAEAQNHLLLGAFLSFIAALGYASMIVCGRFLAADYHPLEVTAVMFAAGTLTLLIINLMDNVVVVHTVQGWALVLYLGLVPTAFAYWLFQKGLRSVSATTASIVSMLDPLVAALLAWGLFGETLTPTGMLGAGLLALTIFLLSGDKSA